jgi:hypothetical protein
MVVVRFAGRLGSDRGGATVADRDVTAPRRAGTA